MEMQAMAQALAVEKAKVRGMVKAAWHLVKARSAEMVKAKAAGMVKAKAGGMVKAKAGGMAKAREWNLRAMV